MIKRVCEFSPCRKYRYTLWREWAPMEQDLFSEKQNRADSYLMCIGLNPSTADENNNDPTIRRVIDFARQWGFGALCMTNLFAYRETDPEVMKKHPSPIGPKNLEWLTECSKEAGMILAAWGKHGTHICQDAIVERVISPLYCLGTNGDGTPKHPLYLPAVTQPVRYPPGK